MGRIKLTSEFARGKSDPTSLSFERKVVSEVLSIINNDEQVIGNSEVLQTLKKAILAEADTRIIIDIIASDPALAAHMLHRNNLANMISSTNKKNRTLKDAVLRTGMVNLYRYAFTYYLKEKFDRINEPYRSLVYKYWEINESIAHESMVYLKEMNDKGLMLSIDKNELQTLALFSIFGQIVALTAFAHIDATSSDKIPILTIKNILDNYAKELSITAFSSLGIDDDLVKDFKVAHGIDEAMNPDSIGLIIRRILIKKRLRIAS